MILGQATAALLAPLCMFFFACVCVCECFFFAVSGWTCRGAFTELSSTGYAHVRRCHFASSYPPTHLPALGSSCRWTREPCGLNQATLSFLPIFATPSSFVYFTHFWLFCADFFAPSSSPFLPTNRCCCTGDSRHDFGSAHGSHRADRVRPPGSPVREDLHALARGQRLRGASRFLYFSFSIDSPSCVFVRMLDSIDRVWLSFPVTGNDGS